jgi:hypothetical protein
LEVVVEFGPQRAVKIVRVVVNHVLIQIPRQLPHVIRVRATVEMHLGVL